MPLLPAGEQMVEGGVALDAIAGRETLVAVLCADEAEAVRALAAARAALAKAGTAGLMPRLELPCDKGRAVLVKAGAAVRCLTAVALFLAAAVSEAAAFGGNRVAVVIGNDVGEPSDARLRYARADARRMATSSSPSVMSRRRT